MTFVPEVRAAATRPSWIAKLSLLALGAVSAFAATFAYRALYELPGSESSAQSVLRGTSNVVHAVRDLANLETTSFHLERVIDLRERKSHLFGLVEADDAILLVAAADVVAGFDLSELREEDVQIDAPAKGVKLMLPPPRILSARLDNERTYVHSRTTDALAQRKEGLETQARQEAERRLRQAALDAGILARARHTGGRTVRGLLQSLGFEQIELIFRDE